VSSLEISLDSGFMVDIYEIEGEGVYNPTHIGI